MESMIKVLEIIVPIFVTILLGMLAKRKSILSEEACGGLQQFVMKFCLPCVLFNSCLTGNFGMESVTAMALVLPLMLLSSLWSFRLRKKKFHYHNLPQLFSAQETGMLGIPLFMTLFGTAQAYRMGVLDVAQSIVAIPVIAILSADTGKNPSVGYVVRQVIRSPLLLMSLLGLALNLTGAISVLNDIGIGGIITQSTGFLAQPVSAVILFCVGYNFSLGEGNRRQIFQICGLHLLLFAVFCAIMQGLLCFVPSVEAETRWSILLFCALPGSFLAAGLGKTREDSAMAAGVCSVLTLVCLVIFCIMAVVVA
jgi:predicted permease